MVSAKVETIGPRKAEQYLAKMGKNRRVLENKTVELARRIVAGEFKLNGEPIIFNERGELIDGQHRLQAIILAGKAVELLVVRGVKAEVTDTLDDGTTRKQADVLGLHGEKHAAALASALKLLWKYNNGDIYDPSTPSNVQIMQLLEAHPRMRTSIKLVAKHKKLRLIVSESIAAFVHYKASKLDKTMADTFIQKIATGEELSQRDPEYALRERLLRERARNGHISNKARLGAKGSLVLLIKAWQQRYTGRRSRLIWTPGEKAPAFTKAK